MVSLVFSGIGCSYDVRVVQAANGFHFLQETCHGLMVASGGDVAVVTLDGDAVTLPALAAGVQYAFRIVRVKATGTTATGLVGLV